MTALVFVIGFVAGLFVALAAYALVFYERRVYDMRFDGTRWQAEDIGRVITPQQLSRRTLHARLESTRN